MTENFFAIAMIAHEVTLWILILLSILSVAFILERFFTLGKIRAKSQIVAARVREILSSNNLSELEDLGKERESVEGRALSYGLRHVREKAKPVLKRFSLHTRPLNDRFLSAI